MSPRAVVVGGAGDIAREIGARLAARGDDLVLVDRDDARLAAAAQILPAGARVEAIRCDLADATAVADLADRIAVGDLSDLDLLVNAAGSVAPGDVADLPADDLTAQIHVNLLAPMLLSQAAVRAMSPRGRGDVLSLISLGGIIALPGSAAYSAGKFGLRGFQAALAAEVRPRGLRVMGIFPGGVDTAMLRHEATHGGTPLTFLGAVLGAARVAEAAMDALDSGRLETYVPYGDSLLTRAVGAWPWLLEPVLPLLRRLGGRGLDRYRARLGLHA